MGERKCGGGQRPSGAVNPRTSARGHLTRWAALLGIAGGACTVAPPNDQLGRPPGHDAAVAVRTAPVEVLPVCTYLTGLGTVAALQTVTVRPLVEGRLLAVHFREGQAVHRGEKLATLDLRPFEIAVRNAEGALMRDRATLENARLNLRRNHDLRDEALVSEQAVTDQGSAVAQGEGLVRVDEAALAQARYQLEQAHVTSPIDGVTGVRQLDAGNLVRASEPNGLVVVAQLDPVAVLFTLPEHARVHVSRAMAQGTVAAEAYVRDGEAPVAGGEVRVIDNQMAPGSGSVRLKAVLDNPNHALWPGQFVKLRLRLATLPPTPVVPAAALQHGNDGEFVYVLDPSGEVRVRAVTRLPAFDNVPTCAGPAGQPCDDGVPLADGPAAGEAVVVDGQLRLRPGARARVVAPEGAPYGPTAPNVRERVRP